MDEALPAFKHLYSMLLAIVKNLVLCVLYYPLHNNSQEHLHIPLIKNFSLQTPLDVISYPGSRYRQICVLVCNPFATAAPKMRKIVFSRDNCAGNVDRRFGLSPRLFALANVMMICILYFMLHIMF